MARSSLLVGTVNHVIGSKSCELTVKTLSGCRNGSSKGLKFERQVRRERSGRDLSRGPKQHFLLPGTCGINHIPLVQVHSKPGEKRVHGVYRRAQRGLLICGVHSITVDIFYSHRCNVTVVGHAYAE